MVVSGIPNITNNKSPMSSYQKQTVHPETKQIENAEWIDDYFGNHNYGVRFPSDGKVFRADEFDWLSNPETLAFEGRLRYGDLPITIDQTEKGSRWDHPMHEVEQHPDGKRTTITKHEDGRQDVKIEVSRLDLKDPSPEDTKSAQMIEEAMAKKIVTVVVIHKPTNESATFQSPLPEVRKRAEAVFEAYNKRLEEKIGVEGAEAPSTEFCVVEFDAGQVRVTSLL